MIRSGICHAKNRYGKINSKYMKDCDPSTKLLYLLYCGVNDFYGLAVSQKLLVNSFEWKKKKSKFTWTFIQNCDDSNKDCILEVDVTHSKWVQKRQSESCSCLKK